MSNLDNQLEEVSKDTMKMFTQLMKNEKLWIREDKFRSSTIQEISIPEKDTKQNGAKDITENTIEENFSEPRKD